MPRKRGNGDGTIYKMESKGLWAAQLTIGVDANGKPKRKTIYGKRQADVRAKLDALKNELATGSVIEPDKITSTKKDGFFSRPLFLPVSIFGLVKPNFRLCKK